MCCGKLFLSQQIKIYQLLVFHGKLNNLSKTYIFIYNYKIIKSTCLNLSENYSTPWQMVVLSGLGTDKLK
jgi:hypothetical protein